MKAEQGFELPSLAKIFILNCCAILARVTQVTLLLSHVKHSLEVISVDDDWLPS